MTGHMNAHEFRRHGHAVIDWIADYYERVESFPVLAQVSPGEVRAGLPSSAPEQGNGLDGGLPALHAKTPPGTPHWQHPSFFPFSPANAGGPAILGDLLAS